MLFMPFTTGMDQSHNQRVAPPGTLYEVRNQRIVANGVLELRPGVTGYAGAVPANSPQVVGDGSTYVIESPQFATTVGDTPVLGATSGDIFQLDIETSEFAFVGRHSSALPVRKRSGLVGDDVSLSGFSFTGKQPAVAVNSNGYVLFAGITDTGVAQIALETETGARRVLDRISSVDKIQALAVGATLYVIWQVGTALRASVFSLTTGATNVQSVGTLTSSSAFWDTSSYDGSNWFLVHQSGATTMRVDRFSGTTSTHNATFTVAGTCPCSIFADSATTHVWVGYYNDPTVTGDVRYRVYGGAALAVTLTETTIVSGADIYGPPIIGHGYDYDAPTQTTTGVYAVRRVDSTANGDRAIGVGTLTTSGSPTAPAFTSQCVPVSKWDNYNRIFVTVTNGADSTTLGQSRTLLLRFNSLFAGSTTPTLELASPILPWLGTTHGPEAASDRFHAIARTATRSFFAFPLALTNRDGNPLIRVEVYEFTVSDQERHVATMKLNATTALAGCPAEIVGFVDNASIFRSTGATEIGFAHRPVIVSATQSAGSGLAAGSYSYRALYQYADLNGRRHRSAVSLPKAITTTAAANVALIVSSLDITHRAGASNTVSVHVYRTTNGGTTYHRLPLAANAVSGTATVSISDSYSDSAIADNEILYTDGGVLDNVLAPSCRFFAHGEDRLWCGGLWESSIIECSKIIIPEEPVQFTGDPSHQVVLAAPCTGLAYMDGAVVAFTKSEIYLISGDGPNDQGAGAFPSPRKMAQGIGCTDYRSIVETNVGVMFKSAQGFMLLPRGFGPVQFIGARVRDQTQGLQAPGAVGATLPCISAAVLCNQQAHLARFLMASAADGSSGTNVLTYDIDGDRWYSDDYTALGALSEIGAWADGSTANFVMVNASLSSVPGIGPVWWEGRTTAGDGAADIQQYLKTTWIAPFGPGAWGHLHEVQLSFEVVGNCTVTLALQTDNNTQQSASWAVTTAAAGTARQYRSIMPRFMQGTEYQFEVTATGTSDVINRGVKLFGLALSFRPESGPRPVNAGERA